MLGKQGPKRALPIAIVRIIVILLMVGGSIWTIFGDFAWYERIMGPWVILVGSLVLIFT